MEIKKLPLIYTAHSKHYAFFKAHISKYVLDQEGIPLNPFMSFQYFMGDTVNRDIIRNANNNFVYRADQIWVFGPIANGVLEEIRLAKKQNKPVKYFEIRKSQEIIPISKKEVKFEAGLEKFASEL